ncbi:hypothetical protein [Humibacter sp.]|uniref:hypothetical protein n=1 Tax=Humibacter sp. TaxID=1940291 RepID=UPI002BE2C0FC|nr:hypothetical protein [Humibacter sp.]HVX08054.1 hypothetical protein [Humibacter sp.]
MSWSWTLFGGSAAIGVVGVLGSYVIARRSRLETNHWSAYPAFIGLSIAVAVLAAGFELSWLLITFAGYVLLANFAAPLVLLARLRRETTHSCASSRLSSTGSSCDATACATCPLATQRDVSEPHPATAP